MQTSNASIKTTGLTYSFSAQARILSDINLHVERGSVYGFLGPNGSGKTTTLRLLLGLLQMQEGSIEIFGQDIRVNRVNILRKIGSLIETPSLYGHLTASENLEVYRPIYGAKKSRIAEVLKITGLGHTDRKLVKNFSLGMKQRLSLALALLPNPELLILDEPTNGLDPNGIIELRELVKYLNKEEGITLLVSSHILSEVEKMVSHVGIIVNGRLLFQGSLPELSRFKPQQSTLLLHTSDNEAAARILESYQPEQQADCMVLAYDELAQVAAINRQLHAHNLDVYLLQPQENNLEKLFMDLTTTPA